MRPEENECVVQKFIVAFGSFWNIRRVVKCYSWASNDAVASLLYADMFQLCLVIRFYTGVMNLHSRSHASSLKGHFSLKREANSDACDCQ